MRLTRLRAFVSLTIMLVVTMMPLARAASTAEARQEAFRLYEAGRFEDAVGLLDRVIENHPRDIEAIIKRGNSLLRLDRPQKALEDFDRVIKRTPLNPSGHTDRGIALLMLGRNDEALASFERANRYWSIPLNGARGLSPWQTRSIQAGKSTVHSGIAQAYHRMGRNDEAVEEYGRAIAINPGDPNAYIGRGDALAALGRDESALADYNEAVRLGPGFSRAYSSRGELLAELGREEAALADFDWALQVEPGFARGYRLRGGLLSRRGENDRALADLDTAIRLNPDNPGGYKDRGGVLVRMGQHRRAIDDLNKAIELDPNLATAYLNRGAAYNSLGQYERAIDDLARAIKLDPQNAGAHTNIGLAYSMVNQYDHAIESLSEAVRLSPRSAVVLLNRGNVYARLGFRDQAAQDYAAAEQLNPRLIASYGGGARLLEEMGRQSLALRDVQRMGSRPDAGELDVRYERGNDKRARGDWQGAIAEFDRVLAADPNRAEACLARGWAKLCGGETGAEHDARAYLKLKGYRERTSTYMVLLGYLSAKRAGKEEDAQAFLDEARGQIPGDAWPQPVLRLFRREISPTTLLRAAKNETQETEAHTFLALDMLNLGNREDAIEHLTWVRDHGVSRSIATDVARATLERIDPGQAIARRSREKETR
jgi:tetratricopeptide (TPR) repeat protein